MNKYKKALKFFNIESSNERKEYQKDAPKGMFDNLNKQSDILIEAVKKAVKKAQTFDIINNKNVAILLFKKCKELIDYNSRVFEEKRFLTQQEFDLLKEVLNGK